MTVTHEALTDTTQVMNTNPSQDNSVTTKISNLCLICYFPLKFCWNVTYELPNNLKFDKNMISGTSYSVNLRI